MSDPHINASFVAPEISVIAPHFPGYEIQNLIATGGMGAVYRAIQKSLDRTVAIKILPREFTNDPSFCEGFEAEAKAMARLNHPNLISVYDFGAVDGMLYIIMEYVPGKSLFDSVNRIAIAPTEVIRLATGICNGLSHAHENGILHRDIKPSNILLDLNAEPKIGDFGLARPIDTKIKEGEEIYGTPHYTAPEVVNSPQSVDFRADIFSLGVLLHELLTGRLPADDPRNASAISHCDPRFDAIIRRATDPIPSARYSSAAEICKDLALIANSAGTSSSVPQSSTTQQKRQNFRPGASNSRQPARKTVARPKYAHTKKISKSSSAPKILFTLIAIAIVGFLAHMALNIDPSPPSAPPKPISETTKKELPKTYIPSEPLSSTSSTLPKNSYPSLPNQSEPSDHPGFSNPSEPTTPESESESESESNTSSTFDTEAFFIRARKIMQNRASSKIYDQKSALAENFGKFEKAVNREIRQLERGKIRDSAQFVFNTFLEQCRENDNLIPKPPSPELRTIYGINPIQLDFYKKQEKLDELFTESLFQLSATYSLGLTKQIERLNPETDEEAIKEIKEENQKNQADPKHFFNLMLDRQTPMQKIPPLINR